MKLIRPFIWVLALAPAALLGASKDTQLLQREIGLLDMQVQNLQKTLDSKLVELKTLMDQSLAAQRRSGEVIAVLERGISDRMGEQQKTLATPLATMNTKMEQVASDFMLLRESISELTERMGKMQTQLVDLSNTVKVLSAPPAPPPSADPSSSASATPPPGMTAKAVYESAMTDRSGGNLDLALRGFQEYLRYYGGTELAPNAQFYVGQIYYDKNEFNQALSAFDTVLEKYPENSKTADATYMKGMSLLKSGQRNEAAREFLNVITNFPNAEVTAKAKTQRKALGLSVPAAPSTRRARK